MRQSASIHPKTSVEPELAVLVLEPARRRTDIPALVLTGPSYVVGSSVDVDVRIPLEGIEPRHCTLEVLNGRVQLQSHSPRTWLNDGPTRRATMRAGDRLVLGPWEFRIRKATTEELLQHLPRQEDGVSAPLVSSAPPPSVAQELDRRNFDALHNLERELRQNQPEVRPEIDPPQEKSGRVVVEPDARDAERLDTLLSGWEAEAESLRGELLAQAELLNAEIRRQQDDLNDLQQQARRSAEELDEARRTRYDLQGTRQQTEAKLTELDRREQELQRRASELDQQRQYLADQQANQEYVQRRQQTELAATAQWWEQRSADLRRRQDQLGNLSDLLQENHRELLQRAQFQEEVVQRQQFADRSREETQAELTRREQHLVEWEETLSARDGTIASQLAETTQLSARLSLQSQELASQERNLAERRAVIEARERQLHERETDLASGQLKLDQRDHDLQCQVNLLIERQQDQTEEEQLRIARMEGLAARDAELGRREAESNALRERLARERLELDEDLVRLQHERRQLQVAREQLVQEQDHLVEEQSRFRSDCQHFASELDALTAERRQFEQIQQAAEISAATLLPELPPIPTVSAEAEARLQSEQDELRSLIEQLERSRLEIEDERQKLRDLEASVLDQTQALESERESLLADRLALGQEWNQIAEQRQQSQAEHVTIIADRDHLQAQLHELEENRSQLSAELDQLRTRQLELDKQFEHRHAEVTDWLQEQAGEQPVPASQEARPLTDEALPPMSGFSHWTHDLGDTPDRSGIERVSDFSSMPSHNDVDPQNESAIPEFRQLDATPQATWSHGGDELHSGIGVLSPWNEDVRQPEADSTPEVAPQTSEELRLRSMLAQMFNLPPAADQSGDESGVAAASIERPQSSLTRDVTEAADEIREQYRAVNDEAYPSQQHSKSQFESVDFSAHRDPELVYSPVEPAVFAKPPEIPEAPQAPLAAVSAPVAPDYSLESADPDSIAAYMERLLQRNRRRGQEDGGTGSDATPPPPPSIAPSPVPATTIPDFSEVQPTAVSHLVDGSGTEPLFDERLELPNRPRKDAQEVRAGIDSLRQVANLSARTAVAKHTWKRTRSLIYVRAGLTLLAFGLGAFLLLWPLPDRENFLVSGYAALFIGIIAGGDFLRTWWLVHSSESLRRKSERSVVAQLPNRVAAATGVAEDYSTGVNPASSESDAKMDLPCSRGNSDSPA